ncbi:MAG: glycine cleavage system protein GcvH [Chromatiales bacterium]|nr:glycine cleavage system protein GcvH [Chromatiales bacterium]MCC5863410.1 glycine cleavage system protein GcvH [Gammaproteobacteria bacterium]
MSEIPEGLQYSRTHEWLREEADGSLSCGITDHAQSALGDLVFVELPAPGRKVTAGEAFATVESTKAASDVYAPVSGEVAAVNDALEADPGLVNSSPYGEGWLLRIKPAAPAAGLLDAAAYRAELDSAGD